MSKLLDHVKRMQEAATRYLVPEDYTDREGNVHTVDQDRTKAFANDMLYMLDGPEQREAQAEAQSMAEQGYPTEDAFLAACRALHWRTAELRYHGIEPVALPQDAAHYPPDDYDFGPSQKLAVEQAAEWRMDLRRQIAQADAVAKAQGDRAKAAEEEVNDLRGRLYDSEMAYAKLRGYVERIEDERPVEMVPAPRERFLAHSPDASGYVPQGRDWSAYDRGQARPRRWFDR
jgi:hypothetical protein